VKKYFPILLVVIATVVFHTSNGFACGNTSEQTTIDCKKSHKSCCYNHSDTENVSDEDCGGDCGGNSGNSSCHCTNSVNVLFLNLVTFKISHYCNTAQKLWHYNQNLPRPIYLTIWTPPKISQFFA
jgi:hypothetical protein